MLYRASVLDVRDKRISRSRTHIAVVMQHYPRFLKKELVDEYVRSLAPEKTLFTEFKAKDRELKDHNRAFAEVNYEARFGLSEKGFADLDRLVELSRTKDVCLICQCVAADKCHADLLLVIARKRFGANTPPLRHSYPLFETHYRQE